MIATFFQTRRAPATALAALLMLAACGTSPGEGSSAESAAAQASQESSAEASAEASSEAEKTPGTNLTACELVTAGDIESALGLDAGTVADGVLEQTPTTIDPAANVCTYDGDWGKLIVNATPTAGTSTFNALAKVYGEDAEALDVGDGGYWFEDNDRGYFLKGSVMVFMQFVFIADGTKFREPTITLGEGLVAKI